MINHLIQTNSPYLKASHFEKGSRAALLATFAYWSYRM